MRSFGLEAIILSRRDFGEADAYLTVFSHQEGKLSLLAKGARRINSRRAPHLQTFSYSNIFVHQTAGQNLLVTQAQAVRQFSHLREDIKKIGLAFYASELVSRLTREYQEQPAVFSRLLAFFDNLNSRPLPSDPYEQIIKNFQSDIIHFLGFGDNLLAKKTDLRYYIEQLLEGNLKSPDFLDKIV